MTTQFPKLSFSRAALYPLTGTNNFKTAVLQFTDDTEQRWVRQRPMQEFELTFIAIDGYSVSVVREFWQSMKSADQATFTLGLGTGPHGESMSWSNLAFTDDDFKISTSQKANRWDLTLHMKQLI
jgi:hypothetical protein